MFFGARKEMKGFVQQKFANHEKVQEHPAASGTFGHKPYPGEGNIVILRNVCTCLSACINLGHLCLSHCLTN